MKTNKITDQDNNINLNKNQIITHENFSELKDLNEKMENLKILNIDYTLDHDGYKEMLVPLEDVLFQLIEAPLDYVDWVGTLSKRIVAIVLFKGKLYMFKQDFIKIQKYRELHPKDNYGVDIIKKSFMDFHNLRDPKGSGIPVHVHHYKRSYFMTPKSVLKALNIDFFILNKLISEGILKVVVQNFDVFFCSYQVQEIQHILSKEECHELPF